MRVGGRAAALLALAVVAAGAVLWRQAPELTVPEGFEAEVFAQGLAGVRWMAFGPDGRLYATLSRAGRVVRLHDTDDDGRADSIETVVDGLDRPHGLAWHGRDLWVAETGRVLWLPDATRRPGVFKPQLVVDSLPAGGQHWSRTLIFDPSGHFFYLSVGSSCNVCDEAEGRRAAVLRFPIQGGVPEIYARGLRNAVGLAFHPETGELWATDNGRDWLGDDLPPEELNALHRGRHYGWPQCYGARIPNPEYADRHRCAGTEAPLTTFPAHTAPLGIGFYTGDRFPEEYYGDAFVALHGSWNRSTPVGYKVVRVRVRAGRPTGGGRGVEDFVSGWLGARGRVRGRPVQPLVGPDGALYVSDDHGGRIWRIAWAESG